jgi:uncharacterized repeat protein (TIGR02543 family)
MIYSNRKKGEGMSKKKLAGIIVACAIAIILAIVLVSVKPWEQAPSSEAYTLIATASPLGAGYVSVSGGEYEPSDQVTLTANPASGYTFDHWSGGASGTSPTITITMDSNKSVTANFKVTTQMYTLTIDTSPSGAGSVSPAGGDFEQDAEIVIVETPAAGYEFSHWSGDASGTDRSIILIMDKNRSVVANFDREYVWMTPVDATASGYTIWGDTWYTGPPSLAIDGKTITAWTLNDTGDITFDLGSEKLIAGIEAYWGGHVKNGNTVNVYVDGQKVLSNEQFGATRNVRYLNPVRGRFVRYQTVALPHNEYLQIATWSEIAEFKVAIPMEE